MNVALEIVELERLQNDLSGAAGARRYPDDGDRSRPQKSSDGFRSARRLRTVHAGSLSGWNINRCVPSSSVCQCGLTFMPTFRSSSLQLMRSAMKLMQTSIVTLATAYCSRL